MQILSYNVNGIRAALRKGLTHWLSEANSDIVCIQETKAQPAQIDNSLFEELGFQCFWHSAEKKGYSGVGLLTKIPPDKVIEGMNIATYDKEGRILRADFADITVISAYFPSGSSSNARQEVKMNFIADFQKFIDDLKQKRPHLVISGDFNICHKPIDIHNPEKNKNTSGFLPEEREWFDGFVESGFVDSFREFHPEPHRYSWWTYRTNSRARNKGWRIDYHIVAESLKPHLKNAGILTEAHHSDHCPVMVEVEKP